MDPTIASDNAIMEKAMKSRDFPELLAGMAIKADQAGAGRIVFDRWNHRFIIGCVFLAEIGKAFAADKNVIVNADETPFRSFTLPGRFGQLNDPFGFTRLGIEDVAAVVDCQIDRVFGGHIIRSPTVRAGNVLLVIGRIERCVCVGFVVVDTEGAKVVEVANPEDSASVDVAGADAVDAFNEHASADDLFGRAVAVTREDVRIRAATKPEDAERELQAAVVGFNGIGDIAILVGPVGGIGEGTFPENDQTRIIFCDLPAFQIGRVDQFANGGIQRERSTIRSH